MTMPERLVKTIWIVYPYGDIIGENFLEARHIRFGRMLAQNGYRVIFWTANFSHTFKRYRCTGWKTINVCENFDVELVPSSSYSSNISIGRALFEIKYARNLAIKFGNIKKPDLILTAGTGLLTAFYPVWPYIKKNLVPAIYDIMDVHLFNSYMKQHHKFLLPFAKILTNNIERREKPFYQNVSAVCGLGRNQVEIAKKRTGKQNISSCLVYNSIVVEDFRKKMKLDCRVPLPAKESDEIWCVYAGSLGPSYDIETLLACAEIVKKNDNNIRFIIAGAGPQEKLVDDFSKKNNRITFIGSVNPNWLPAIYKKCDIGLCTYASYSTVDMPDKFYDYTAAGLAVVNSLQGEIKGYVKEVGVQYEAENSDSLYKAIKKTIKHLEEYKGASYKLANRFDLNEQMKPLLEMINDLVNNKSN